MLDYSTFQNFALQFPEGWVESNKDSDEDSEEIPKKRGSKRKRTESEDENLDESEVSKGKKKGKGKRKRTENDEGSDKGNITFLGFNYTWVLFLFQWVQHLKIGNINGNFLLTCKFAQLHCNCIEIFR